ncbi:MAG: SufS family cysteine desulfurase, partial [Saprospiraceae bacterium]|nr:SufS family cysteine desulfurase [Saprospiraceae bacterium]
AYPHTYLDNAATTHKPVAVLNAMDKFHRTYYGTVHRGIYHLSAKSTEAFEQVRSKVKDFLGASDRSEIIFTSGTTEGINLVAQTHLLPNLTKGENVVVSISEHHANFIPWQQVANKKMAEFRYMPLTNDAQTDLEKGLELIDDKTKLVAIHHMSNVLGILNPLDMIIEKAHSVGAKVLVDAAQSAAHIKIKVQDLGCDFLVFSGHKIYGPTGIGVLFGRRSILEQMPPYQYGGEMIRTVSPTKSTWREPPHRFEAGTPALASVIGLGAAIDYLEKLGWDEITKHSREVTSELYHALTHISGLEIIGPDSDQRLGLVSFNLTDIHPHDLATILDHHRVSVRAGHHCAQPLMQTLKIGGSARASIGIYNNQQDISNLVKALEAVKSLLL